MRDGWREVTLGEATTRRRNFTPVEADKLYRVVGVQRSGWGLVDRAPVRGDSMKFSRLLELHKDDLIYRTITAFEAPSAVVSSEFDGAFVTPQTFPAYMIDQSQLLPEYMAILTTSPKFHEAMSARCVGSVLRRKTLSQGAFESIPLMLPSLEKQRRIVNLIASVDDAVDAAEVEAAASSVVRREAVDALLELHGAAELTELGQLGTFERGKRFTKKDYVAHGLGCIHYGQIYTDYGATASETISFLPSSFRNSARLAHPGNLVIAGTGENVEEIGKAVAWMGLESVAVHDDAFIFRHGLDPVFASALFSSSVFLSQRAPSDSKVARLSAGSLASIRVPVVSELAQRQIGGLMMALDEISLESRATADALRALRSNLLTVLLSGEHEIPSSYDALLEGEAA